jgi:hypothetical protein
MSRLKFQAFVLSQVSWQYAWRTIYSHSLKFDKLTSGGGVSPIWNYVLFKLLSMLNLISFINKIILIINKSVCPQNAHRMPTERPQNAHRMPTERPQNANRTPTEYPQETYKLYFTLKYDSIYPYFLHFSVWSKMGFW